jgi:hypothetical protein
MRQFERAKMALCRKKRKHKRSVSRVRYQTLAKGLPKKIEQEGEKSMYGFLQTIKLLIN